MSLLLKALKQAEAVSGNAPDDLELEPVAPPTDKRGRDWVEPPSPLFGGNGAPPPPARRRGWNWPRLSLVPLTALLAAVVAVGYGIYLYLQLRPAGVMPPPPAAASSSALPAVAPQQPPSPGPTPPAEAVEATPAAEPTQAPARLVAKPAREAAPAPRPRQAAAAAPAPSATAMPATDTAGTGGIPRFRPDAHAQLLDDAYGAYQRGDLAEAERLYGEAAARSRSTDALLGLAAVAASRGQDGEAVRLYREILERDPRNASAQAALLDLLGSSDSQAAESRLKTLISREPSPHLYQTLGNLYADQQRWADAQAAYFEAYRGAPENADYAYNLAVSLDQLRQYAAALGYYERALAAGGVHRFDRAAAEERVRVLQALP